jgi:hypothetical protein
MWVLSFHHWYGIAEQHPGLVIFHCTFLALRSYDGRRRSLGMFDRELRNETSYFAGYVIIKIVAGVELTSAAKSTTTAIIIVYVYFVIA